MILSERHVQLPVELVLDCPVACHHVGKFLAESFLLRMKYRMSEQALPSLVVLLITMSIHADGLEARPTFRA